MQTLSVPIFLINFKNYQEVAGEGSLKLAKAAEDVSKDLGVQVAVAPPAPFLAAVAQAVHIPVYAQHVDPAELGGTTGAVVAEQVKAAGCVGSLVNHSEKRVSFEVVRLVVGRLESLGMTSMVCARTPEEIASAASLGPTFAAVEPPELIGSGRAVSKVRPGVIVDSVEAARRVNPKVRVVCGAGIVSGDDVRAALDLGSEGVLVASGIVKAKDWRKAIEDLAQSLVNRS